MSRRMLSVVLALSLAASFVVSGCTPKQEEKKPASAVTEVTICQYAQVFVYLPLYIADQKGFFSDEGLKVKLINGGGDDKTFAAVASGNAQFGVADPVFAAIAREKGQPGLVVASVVSGATFWGVTKNPKIMNITNPSQLNGLRIATYQSPSTNYALMANTLRENTSMVGKASIVQGAFGTLLAMLDAGKVDVAMELEPTVSIAEKQGAHVVYSYPQMYGPFLLTGLYTTEDYAKANPEIVQKAVNALERAVQFAHANPAGAAEVAKAAFPEVDPSVIANAVNRMLAEKTIPEHVTVDPRGWDNAVKLRLAAGDLHSADAASATLDTTFAHKAATSITAK